LRNGIVHKDRSQALEELPGGEEHATGVEETGRCQGGRDLEHVREEPPPATELREKMGWIRDGGPCGLLSFNLRHLNRVRRRKGEERREAEQSK
jgi:hypothetical protein